MKMKNYFTMLTLASAVILSSCGKTTKGKMDGEWTIESYTEKSTTTSGGLTSTETTTYSGNTVKTVTEYPGSTTTKTGTINEATWKISKDATFERTESFTYVDQVGGQTITTTVVNVVSGNWDFLSGIGEHKKNERVVFHPTSESTKRTVVSGSLTTNSEEKHTYLEGEVSEVYVVVESKKKSLELKFEGSNSNTSSQGSTSSTSKETVNKSIRLTSN